MNISYSRKSTVLFSGLASASARALYCVRASTCPKRKDIPVRGKIKSSAVWRKRTLQTLVQRSFSRTLKLLIRMTIRVKITTRCRIWVSKNLLALGAHPCQLGKTGIGGYEGQFIYNRVGGLVVSVSNTAIVPRLRTLNNPAAITSGRYRTGSPFGISKVAFYL